jgi:hypothetical protein
MACGAQACSIVQVQRYVKQCCMKRTMLIEQLAYGAAWHPLKEDVDVGVGALAAIVLHDVLVPELLQRHNLALQLLYAVLQVLARLLIASNWLLHLHGDRC